MGCSNSKSVAIKFLMGEIRVLKFEASYPNQPQFIINSAKYQIYHKNKLMKEGDLSVDGHYLTMTFNADQRGFFDLYLELEVGATTRKKHFIIDVD